MIEYTDGSFGEIKPSQEIINQLKEILGGIPEEIRAVHFGTKEELEKKRQEQLETMYRTMLDDLALNQMKLEKKLNKIMIHLGVDDKSEILCVGSFPEPQETHIQPNRPCSG